MPEPCSIQDMEHIEGFDDAQEKSLRARKRPKNNVELSEAEKWRGVYRTLFPHVDFGDIPSPCKSGHTPSDFCIALLTRYSL